MAAGLERRIKIGYIYNFLKSVTWPDGTSPSRIRFADVCIVGDKKLSENLATAVKNTPAMSIKVNVLCSTTSAAIPDCHLLFIDKAAAARLSSILERAGNRPVLTVSDIKGFVDKGGMIELVKVEEGMSAYIRPRVNSAVAEISSITLGQELLLMADHAQQRKLMIISDDLH